MKHRDGDALLNDADAPPAAIQSVALSKGENVDDATPILVSACLAGQPCRYDGKATPHPVVLRLLEQGCAVPVCPEVLGGLNTPRECVELRAGRALCRSGRDVTDEFLRGAQASLERAHAAGCRRAVLKSRSPSCGTGRVYDGSFCGTLVPGDGIFAALLKRHGFSLCTEDDLPCEGTDTGLASKP